MTDEARQILITQVDAGSPADGVLAVDDVILGVGGKPFESDARIAFGRAITEAEKTQNGFLLTEIRAGRVGAAHDLSEGGLLVALAEMLLESDGLGMDLKIDLEPGGRLDATFFGESQGRILVSVDPASETIFLNAAEAVEVNAATIGVVTDGGRFNLRLDSDEVAVQWGVGDLRRIWEKSIEKRMERPGLIQT